MAVWLVGVEFVAEWFCGVVVFAVTVGELILFPVLPVLASCVNRVEAHFPVMMCVFCLTFFSRILIGQVVGWVAGAEAVRAWAHRLPF